MKSREKWWHSATHSYSNLTVRRVFFLTADRSHLPAPSSSMSPARPDATIHNVSLQGPWRRATLLAEARRDAGWGQTTVWVSFEVHKVTIVVAAADRPEEPRHVGTVANDGIHLAKVCEGPEPPRVRGEPTSFPLYHCGARREPKRAAMAVARAMAAWPFPHAARRFTTWTCVPTTGPTPS